MDPQLRLFRRQYFQLFEPDFLAWPPKALLRDPAVQRWLYSNLFDASKTPTLPSERYQLRVLKSLLFKIEKAIEDPNEDEISDALTSHLTTLISSSLPSETSAVQQKSYVTFTCLPPISTDDNDKEPTITLLERRHLISGSLTTGFRTWEAALHLGSYLLTPHGRTLIEGKSVLELGAGTGFLSILAAKYLGAKHVSTTDGDEGVVEALRENMELNGLEEGKVSTEVLRWGGELDETWLREDFDVRPYDVVVGADIVSPFRNIYRRTINVETDDRQTYEKTAIAALVETLRALFVLRPGLQILISGAVRNLETFETFREACCKTFYIKNFTLY